MNSYKRPVLGFAAYSGIGKTTLLTRLMPKLISKGVRVAMIKHAHHDFDIDQPGKDSYELRKAGASQILIASDYRRALITETPGAKEPELSDLVNELNLDQVDLVLVEGFRHLAFPKIELHRPATGKSLIFPDDDNVIAVASDEYIDTGDLPLLDLNDIQMMADYVYDWYTTIQE